MSEPDGFVPKLFATLDAQTRAELSPHLRRERYERGQTILIEGDEPSALYFVEQGLARLVQLSPQGRVFVLGYAGPGDCLNLPCALAAQPIIATAEAVVDTRLAVLASERWRAALDRNPALCRAVVQQLTEQLRATSQLVRELALHPVSARLARFILENMADADPEARWTQESIAASIGSVRDVVGRALRGLIEEGVLSKTRGHLVIKDRQALERIASGE